MGVKWLLDSGLKPTSELPHAIEFLFSMTSRFRKFDGKHLLVIGKIGKTSDKLQLLILYDWMKSNFISQLSRKQWIMHRINNYHKKFLLTLLQCLTNNLKMIFNFTKFSKFSRQSEQHSKADFHPGCKCSQEVNFDLRLMSLENWFNLQWFSMLICHTSIRLYPFCSTLIINSPSRVAKTGNGFFGFLIRNVVSVWVLR